MAGIDSAGHGSRCSDVGSDVHVIMLKLLSSPRALPLFIRFFKNGELSSFGMSLVGLFRSAIGYVSRDVLDASDVDDEEDSSKPPNMKCEMSVRHALELCSAEFTDNSIALLELAVADNLHISIEEGELEPDGFRSPAWYASPLDFKPTLVIKSAFLGTAR